MSTKITRVATLADLPADLAENVASWSGTGPVGSSVLTSEDGERGARTLTGYADAGTTSDGWHLFILRFGASTFTFGYYSPGTTSMTVGSRNHHDSKANIETWVAEQHALDLAPATEAGTVAYNVGRPVEWDHYTPDGWGARTVTDPNMATITDGVYHLLRDRLGRAFRTAWEDNAAHDAACDTCDGSGVITGMDTPCGIQRCDFCDKFPGDLEAALDVAQRRGDHVEVWFMDGDGHRTRFTGYDDLPDGITIASGTNPWVEEFTYPVDFTRDTDRQLVDA